MVQATPPPPPRVTLLSSLASPSLIAKRNEREIMSQEFTSKVGELVGVWAAFHPSNVAVLLPLPAITGSCLDDDDISLRNGILNLSLPWYSLSTDTAANEFL